MSIWEKKFDSSFSIPQVMDLERKKLLAGDGRKKQKDGMHQFHDRSEEKEDDILFDNVTITHDDDPYKKREKNKNESVEFLGNEIIKLNDLYDSDDEEDNDRKRATSTDAVFLDHAVEETKLDHAVHSHLNQQSQQTPTLLRVPKRYGTEKNYSDMSASCCCGESKLTGITKLQASTQAYLKPACWIPGIRRSHMFSDVWLLEDCSARGAYHACLSALREMDANTENQYVIATEDIGQCVIEIHIYSKFEWQDILHIHFKLALRGMFAPVGGCFGEVHSFSTGIIPTSIPLSFLLSMALCWVPVLGSDNKRRMNMLKRKLGQSIKILNPKDAEHAHHYNFNQSGFSPQKSITSPIGDAERTGHRKFSECNPHISSPTNEHVSSLSVLDPIVSSIAPTNAQRYQNGHALQKNPNGALTNIQAPVVNFGENITYESDDSPMSTPRSSETVMERHVFTNDIPVHVTNDKVNRQSATSSISYGSTAQDYLHVRETDPHSSVMMVTDDASMRTMILNDRNNGMTSQDASFGVGTYSHQQQHNQHPFNPEQPHPYHQHPSSQPHHHHQQHHPLSHEQHIQHPISQQHHEQQILPPQTDQHQRHHSRSHKTRSRKNTRTNRDDLSNNGSDFSDNSEEYEADDFSSTDDEKEQ
eukprot:m.42244 g.42244  ORF g.42244 m.42244 type:complete len:645 (-) comp7044_c0_seq4:170-2104(-)